MLSSTSSEQQQAKQCTMDGRERRRRRKSWRRRRGKKYLCVREFVGITSGPMALKKDLKRKKMRQNAGGWRCQNLKTAIRFRVKSRRSSFVFIKIKISFQLQLQRLCFQRYGAVGRGGRIFLVTSIVIHCPMGHD